MYSALVGMSYHALQHDSFAAVFCLFVCLFVLLLLFACLFDVAAAGAVVVAAADILLF